MSSPAAEITTANRSAEKTKRKHAATKSPTWKRIKPLQDLVLAENGQVQPLRSPRIRSLILDDIGSSGEGVIYDDTCEELFNLLDAMERRISAKKRIMMGEQKWDTQAGKRTLESENESFLAKKCERLEKELGEISSENDYLKKQLDNVREIMETLMMDYFKTKSFMENVIQERNQLDREIQILNATLNLKSNLSRSEISKRDIGNNKNLNGKLREFQFAKEELIIAQERFKLIEEDVKMMVGLNKDLNERSPKRRRLEPIKSPHFYVKDMSFPDRSGYVNVTLTDEEEINENSVDQLEARSIFFKSTSGYDCSTPKKTLCSRKVRFLPELKSPVEQSPIAKNTKSRSCKERTNLFVEDKQ